MFPSILGSNRPTTKYASKRPKLPLKRRLKSLQIRPQNYTYLFLYFKYTFFHTHFTSKYNEFISDTNSFSLSWNCTNNVRKSGEK